VNANRPIFISILQYQEQVNAGTLTVAEVLDKLPTFGVAGIELRREIWPNYQSELPTVRDRLRTMGMQVTYATFSTLFSPDTAARQFLYHDMDTAKALGSPLLRIFPGADPFTADDDAWQSANQAISYANSLGIEIALENWGKLPGGKVSEIAHILERIPALKTNIDIGNYATHGEDVLEAIRKFGSRAIYAHLKDKAGDRSDATTYLGGGTLPMRQIITALNALQQAITYCFEFVGDGEADSRIIKSVDYLRGFSPIT
jgi:sugar phosphate isomerase/epimerase